jgi:hypothetical protein
VVDVAGFAAALISSAMVSRDRPDIVAIRPRRIASGSTTHAPTSEAAVTMVFLQCSPRVMPTEALAPVVNTVDVMARQPCVESETTRFDDRECVISSRAV